MDLKRIAAAFRSGERSPVDHVDDVLQRLAADPYNLVVTLDADRALATARERADELAAGHDRGPLHGIALGVKDLIDVAGLPTRCGSNVFADAAPAELDAPVVARLRAAGAVVVAKLHTQEFAHGATGDVSASGPAHNPHDPSRITGGSSSGSAGSLAAGHLPLALGTDTGCSVRGPAALCGVVGLKPRYGRLPSERIFPLSESLDHPGLLSTDVAATATAWRVLAGEPERPAADIPAADIPAIATAGLRVGVLTDDYWRPADPSIAPWPARAVEILRAAGAQVADVRTPFIDEFAAAYRPIVSNEAYATHARWLADRPEAYQPLTRERMLSFADRPARDYIEAQRTRRRLSAEFAAAAADVDVLVLATTRLRATPIGAADVVPDGGDGTPVEVRPALLALNSPFNLTGWPAISIPAPVRGLPIGVQIVGVRCDEATVLEVAAAVEAGWR